MTFKSQMISFSAQKLFANFVEKLKENLLKFIKLNLLKLLNFG